MKKPEFKTEVEAFLDYFDVKKYITEKYNCDEEEEETWDHMCDVIGIRNDTFDYIPTDLNNTFTEAVKLEFGENPRVWISW